MQPGRFHALPGQELRTALNDFEHGVFIAVRAYLKTAQALQRGNLFDRLNRDLDTGGALRFLVARGGQAAGDHHQNLGSNPLDLFEKKPTPK